MSQAYATHLRYLMNLISRMLESVANLAQNQKNPQTFVSETDGIHDGTKADHYNDPSAKPSCEQTNTNPKNTRSNKDNLRHNPKTKCNDNYRYCNFDAVPVLPQHVQVCSSWSIFTLHRKLFISNT